MPKPRPEPKPRSPEDARHTISTEANSYLRGLFGEFTAQVERYATLTSSLLNLEARIELAEKTLSLTRDHLAMTIKQTEAAAPRDWEQDLKSVRFVGVRLADACMLLLQENKRMTPEEILIGLNKGMFRFRTNSPLREIHAALLRQSFAKKTGDTYVWTGGTQKQMPLRLRTAKPALVSTNVINNDPADAPTANKLKEGIAR
jgi:hypothetical protein